MSAMELDNPAPASTTQNAEPAIAEEVESILNGKIQLLPGYTSDLSAATYCLVQEDHTLGNCIRWMLMKDPRVEFCGYSLPHPSEDKIHLRIQTYDRTSSLLLLHEAIKNLENVFTQVQNTYEEDLSRNEFERYEEEELDMEEIKRQGEENKKRMEKRQREEEREKNRRG